ncbi:hypothetical protein K7X08_012418 [Anisodus acutangulus]|uniref:Coiled-coil domain-containing protein 22 homolog n=1 Tax=Anisodus acutangulus TaxID=402998 RepID=A0A9Q1LE26_9SOLA|nr:hypothetical protein K7X08_012418 [Anisodus acutangulus]
MEESQDILLNSIADAGVKIPTGVSSVKDLTPATLFSISSQSLHLIDRQNSIISGFITGEFSFRPLKTLFRPCLRFQNPRQFLYPSEEDLYELVRFLVGRLSDVEARKDAVRESKRCLKTAEENVEDTGLLPRKELSGRQGDPLMMTQTPEPSKQSDFILNKMEKFYNGVDIPIEGRGDSNKETSSSEQAFLDLVEEGVRRSSLRDSEHNFEYGQPSTSPRVHFPQMNCNKETFPGRKEMLVEKSVSSSVELELQEKLDLLKAAMEMASDVRHPSDFYVNKLKDQVEVKRSKIVEMESHWNDKCKALEQKKDSLVEKLRATEPEAYIKYKKVEEIELKLEFILAEKKRREDELVVLSAKAEKQPKSERRRTYIQRIEEITKNSRKQDVDIERILKEARELQLESNCVQERLNRTHAVVDETVFREAKKDQVGRQAYRILTSIHANFQQIAENLLATDRARREVADYEGKLATMTSRSVDIDKLKADLETIWRENDLLEKNVQRLVTKCRVEHLELIDYLR